MKPLVDCVELVEVKCSYDQNWFCSTFKNAIYLFDEMPERDIWLVL